MKKLLLLFAIGCGGAQTASAPASAPSSGTTAVSPEAYAAVSEYFQKKRPFVVTCYNNAITNRKLDAKAAGRVSLGMVINAAGQPQNVRVTDSTLRSPDVEGCLADMVQKWQTPAPGAELEFNFSYEFRPD